jgi:ABC-2 type transport system permease protein
MNARRVLAIARRIAAQFRRDRRSLALLIGAPLVVLALLGWVIRDQKPPLTRLGVVGGSNPVTAVVAEALRHTAQSEGLPVVDVGTDEASARAAIGDGRADVAIVLPMDLGPGAAVRVITLGEVAGDDAARLQQVANVLGDALTSARGGAAPRVDHVTVYGAAGADLLDTFAPALIGFFGFFFVFVLTGISFLRERIGGTLERLLATPVRRSEIVAGYSLGFGIFATLQVTVILLFALGVLVVPAVGPVASFAVGLGIPSAGSPLLAFIVVVLAAIGAVNLAIFVSTFARSELQVVQFIPIVVVPQAFLCGIFWSVSSLPDALQAVARVLPMTYAVDGLRAVLIRGADLADGQLQLDLAVLAAVAVLFVALGGATIRREIV